MLDDRSTADAYVAGTMPGDDLIEGPVWVGTQAIDIAADRGLVFDFLAQMGFKRAGWYSYDLLDNLGRKSASTVHQEWLVETAGELVPGGPIEFVAAVVERPGAYVLRLPHQHAVGHAVDFTLAYRLDETTVGTRLVSRARLIVDGPAGPLLSRALRFGDGVMVRRQLQGLKQRCESHGSDNSGRI